MTFLPTMHYSLLGNIRKTKFCASHQRNLYPFEKVSFPKLRRLELNCDTVFHAANIRQVRQRSILKTRYNIDINEQSMGN